MSASPLSRYMTGLLVVLVVVAGVVGYLAGSSVVPATTLTVTKPETRVVTSVVTQTQTIIITGPTTPTPTTPKTTPTTPTTPVAPYSIKIYTGGTGGVYYPIGVKLADILSRYSGGRITATASSSGASVANVRALGAGDANLILVQNDVAYYAYHGLFMFEGSKIPNVRGVASLYPEIVHAIVRVDSGIKSLSELEGKRIAVGPVGSGAAVEAEIVLRAANLWDKITPQYLDYNQAAEALKLGQIEAIIICTGLGTPSVVELSVTHPIRLLDIPDDVLSRIVQQGYTFFVRYVVPKGTYNGMDKEANSLAIKAMLAVSSDVPDDVVYTILKVMFDHVEELREAHARAQDIKLETALEGVPIILHPGAVRYYEEKGITIPSYLRP